MRLCKCAASKMQYKNMEETETQCVRLPRMKKSEADKYTHLWTLLALFLTLLRVKHLLELLLHLLFSFSAGRRGLFSSSKPIVLAQDVWPRLCSRRWEGERAQTTSQLLSGARWMVALVVLTDGSACPTVTRWAGASTWALVPSENKSSSPAFRYWRENPGLVHPNWSLGTERGVRWVGRDPGLIHRSK